MGIVKAFSGAIGGTFADQWKEIVTSDHFDEHAVVMPGVKRQSNNGRGSNFSGSYGVISNGSKIFVPEGAAAVIYSQAGIESIVTDPGGYEYQSGQDSIYNNDGVFDSIFKQAADRLGYGGQTAEQKLISFVNLREIRGIKFGTRGPLAYHDTFYKADLEVLAFGSFSLRVTNVERFMRAFVPANVQYYSFDDPKAREQILSEFLKSFVDALNSLSTKYRISQLPSQANELASSIADMSTAVGSWSDRFGFQVIGVGIENIDFSPESKKLVNKYSTTVIEAGGFAKKRELEEYTYQQERSFDVAENVAQNEGVGEFSSMGIGLGMVSGIGGKIGSVVEGIVGDVMSPVMGSGFEAASKTPKGEMSFDEQIEKVKKLKELLDDGILTQDEFDLKKKEIMNL